MLVLVGVDDAVSGKRRRTTIRVVHDDDILDAEKMPCHRDRAEPIYRSATGNDDLEERGGRADLVALRVDDDVAGVDLAKLPSNGRRNTYGAWVIAIDDNRSQRNRLGKFFTHCGFLEAGLFRKHVSVKIFHSLLHSFKCYAAGALDAHAAKMN